ncbi:MAG: hypothetical protein HY426_05080 [Candidatus Levybacteria bacterium]|nr:hypothetical protein [Candidatus Levybacteria bacterium]
MERLKPIPVPIGGEVKTPDGGTLTAVYEDPNVARRDQIITTSTDVHEAGHGVVGKLTGSNIIRMRTRLSGKIRGDVVLDGLNLIAAASSQDENGNGHDTWILEQNGVSPIAMGAIARGYKNRARDEIHEVAAELAIRRELGDSDVESAMKDGKEGRKVVVLYKNREGNRRREIRTRVKGPVAMVPDVEYELPIAA